MEALAISREAPRSGLPRLELRIERLQMVCRFTFAFHAREVRFEVAEADGVFRRIFPETFSFDADRHDPTELLLQLEDMLAKPRLIAARASSRDARDLVVRIISGAPHYLEEVCRHRAASHGMQPEARRKFHQDVALLSQLLLRFNETHDLDDSRPLRMAGFAFRRRIYESLRVVVAERVDPAYLEGYIRGEINLVDPADDPTESGFFRVMETGENEAIQRMALRMAERAFYLWLEGVCLVEENQAFEKDDSPFESREAEVLMAISRTGERRIERSRDLMPFLCRAHRDSQRLLGKLERWFLRSYDIRHSSAIIHHAASLDSGRGAREGALTWHTPKIHASVLGLLLLPFVAAAFVYPRAPRLFDLVFSAEILAINSIAVWFLLYRFCWKRDLSFFHASVPRIGAGIIVGYLPVFLIDEVWDLASRQNVALDAVVLLLGLVTLLYIYVEIARRIADTAVAFARARALFLLGVLEAFAVGVVMTSLVGPFMVARNWSPDSGEVSIEVLRETLPPMIGALPHVVGTAPLYAFPSAVLLMTFLSFFIGIFLQLMWEELPITEPL